MCPTIRHLDHFSDETVTAQVFFSDLQTSHCFWAFQMQMYFMFGFLLQEHLKMHHDQNAPLLSSHMRERERVTCNTQEPWLSTFPSRIHLNPEEIHFKSQS